MEEQEEKEGCEYDELRCESITPIEIEMTQNEALRQHTIVIEFLHRGCIVRVGCKSIAFESNNEAIRKIQQYASDPIGMQKTWKDILN
jgi:hypothetical protein